MKKTIPYQDSHAISYAEYGGKTGLPILINHGLIASIDDYNLFERLIRLDAYLICIARPGYGESSPYVLQNIAEWAELVETLIDHLHVGQFDVLGMSSGAPYSYALGYKFPERVRQIYIYSGIPALYDDEVQSHWPFEVKKNASIVEMQSLAHELFFSHLSKEDLERDEIKDSMRNHCFGIAQDLRVRCNNWGFDLSEIRQKVYMQHSKMDNAVPFITAELTSKLLPNCKLIEKKDSEHFSPESLEEFIESVIAGNYHDETSENIA